MADPEYDSFRYGSRFVEMETAEGNDYREVPLTWEDLFDPQEGDVMVHGTLHARIIRRVGTMLDVFFESRGARGVLVCDDVKMLWKDPTLQRIAPDVAVILGVRDPQRPRKSFDEAREGTRPAFVLEVVSESTRKFDQESKPSIYRQAGVRESFLLDPLATPWTLQGRRLSPTTGRYRKIRPDRRGRLLSEATGLYFSVAEDGESLTLEDAATGERLQDPVEESMARKAAERRAEAAERRIAELEAKLARPL